MSSLEVALDDFAALAEFAGKSLGITGPVGVGILVAGMVLRGADNVVRVIEAGELERIRQAKDTGEAAGRAAYEASHQGFHRGKP